MDLFTSSTAAVVCKMGSALRRSVQENRRAKPVKKFVIKAETTEEDLIREQERASIQKQNRRKYPLGPEQ